MAFLIKKNLIKLTPLKPFVVYGASESRIYKLSAKYLQIYK